MARRVFPINCTGCVHHCPAGGNSHAGVLEDARELAKVTVCATRQHQLGIGLLLYANDNGDCSPPPYGHPDYIFISTYVFYSPYWRGLGLVYCPAAGRLRSKMDDPGYGWTADPAYIGVSPHGGSVLVNHELRQPNMDRKTTVTELAEKKMAWVFDELVYLGEFDYAEEAPFGGRGFNVMFPDTHVSWQDIPPPPAHGRQEVHQWLIDNIDGRY